MSTEEAGSRRLRSFFLGLTLKSFEQLALGHGAIAEYVATVLTDFSVSDRWLALRDARGRRLMSVVEMLIAVRAPAGERSLVDERELRKYVGDYTLFMSGIFRRFVERSGHLDYYLEEGRLSYGKVSSIDALTHRPGFLLFEDLSSGFEYYSGALDYMRKCFFAPAPGEDPFADFFQHVKGWMKLSVN
jgi:hypothetical protein